MRAMLLDAPGRGLRAAEIAMPEPGPGELLLEVRACGVCRTDLHIADGELAEPKLPLVLGHQIVARATSDGERFKAGDRVGVPWLGWTDGTCRYCTSGRENLRDNGQFTGYNRDGGIHMSDIPSFPYELLWGERVLRSVANLTRRDGEEFLAIAAEVPVKTQLTTYPLEDAGRALDDLREGAISGSAVVQVKVS